MSAELPSREGLKGLNVTRSTPRVPDPYGCGECGIGAAGHALQNSLHGGLHNHIPPTPEQIKTRMQARRAARLDRKAAR
jgi:hypothetical protein